MTEDRARTICIHNGFLWSSADEKRPERGGLFIENGRIARLLSPRDFSAAQSVADESFDAGECLLLPPLFDGHVHSPATLLRGTENCFPLELWSYYAINYGRGFTDRDVQSAIMLTAAEMIRNGVGGYIDHFPPTHFADAALAAHLRTGLRVGFAPFFADLVDEQILAIPIADRLTERFMPRARRQPHEIHELFAGLRGMLGHDGTVTLLAGPNAPQRCSERLWSLWLRLRQELDIGSHTHLLETWPQAAHTRDRWPGGLVARLDEAGLLDSRLSVAHGVWLSGEDRALLARRGVTLVHNPVSNRMLGSGTLDVRAALDAGVPLALGTDSANTGGRHDLFEIMRHMLSAGRYAGSDYDRWVTPIEVFRAATGGVRALGTDFAAPSLSTGSLADVLLIDPNSAPTVAAPLTVESVVRHADARSVRALMVDGVWLYRDNRIEVFDEVAVNAEARCCAEALRRAAEEAAPDLLEVHRAFGPWYEETFSATACPQCGQHALPRALDSMPIAY
jgi:cytosine/adenosine deaminase-related metal-dependent hydrolase